MHDRICRFCCLWLCIAMLGGLCSDVLAQPETNLLPAGFQQPAPEQAPDLFVWTDTCNVGVIRDGNRAILIDLGDGSVLDHLSEIGVEEVEWVLFTHHHREQCQGISHINRDVTRIAAPQAEQELFEQPANFRKWRPRLGDKYSVHGASYVRPPAQPIPIDRLLQPGDQFEWRGHKLNCLSTPGHSPGGMTYVLNPDGEAVAFLGGVMHDGARMTTWFDTEWDYGFAKGIDTLIASVESLQKEEFSLAINSHGPAIRNPNLQLEQYEDRLNVFRQQYVRGYPVFDSTPEQRDSLSQPTPVPLINRVTPHLYKLSHLTKGKNFAIIVSDQGHGLILDCGLMPESMLDEIIAGMREHMGLKQIDAFWISHMHGDHFLLGPALKEKHGAEAWTLDIIADKCEHPLRYDYPALIPAYGTGIDGMMIEKKFRNGETIDWEGYRIQVDWMPGQTEFGCCLWLEIDGKRVAFTGDNLFGDASDPQQNGHECVVARNSAILEEGYVYGSRYLLELKPDIVMGSHSYVMDDPAEFLQRYHDWSLEMLRLYKEILPNPDYEYLYDPFWVSACPYRVDFSKQDQQPITVTIRNFQSTPQHHRVELKLPPGVTAEPQILEGVIKGESREAFEVSLKVDRSVVGEGVHIIPFDITIDGTRHGELFDFLIRIPQESSPSP